MRRRIVALLSVLVLAALVVGYWLVRSESGARWLAQQAMASVPGLTIGRVDGNLSDTLQLIDLSWRSSGKEVRIARIEGEVFVPSVLGGGILIERLALNGVEIALDQSPTAVDVPTAPDSVALPALTIVRLGVDQARIARGDTTLVLDQASARIEMGGTAIAVSELSASGPQGSVAGRLALDLAAAQPIASAEFAAAMSDAQARRWTGTISARPAGPNTALSFLVTAPVVVSGEAKLDARLEAGEFWLQLAPQSGAAFEIDGEIAALVQGKGAGGRWQLGGGASALGEQLRFDGGALGVRDDALEFDDLGVVLERRGRVLVTGTAPLSERKAWKLDLRSDELLVARTGALPLRLAGAVSVVGAASEPSATIAVRARSDGWPDASAEGSARWRDDRLMIEQLTVFLPRGRATIAGELSFDEPAVLDARLEQIDPAMLAPQWPGTVNARAQWQGSFGAAGVAGTLRIEELAGTLRGLTLAGDASMRLDAGDWREGVITLGLGRARIDGRADAATDSAELTLEVPQMSELFPAVAGSATATWRRDGASNRVELATARLRGAGFAVGTLAVEGELGAGIGGIVDLELSADDIEIGARRFDSATLAIDGTRAANTWRLALAAPADRLELDAAGALESETWRGQLQSINVRTAATELAMREPTAVRVARDGSFAVERGCLAGPGSAICFDAEGSFDSGSANLLLGSLSLASLRALLPGIGLPALEGLVEGQGRIVWSGNAPLAGEIALRSPRGLARLPDRPDLDLGYRAFALAGSVADGTGRISGSAELIPEGRVDLVADLSRDAAGQFGYDAVIDVAIKDLSGIEAFTTVLAEPEGDLRGQVRVRGGHHGESLSGALALTQFTAQVPRYALRLREGVLVLAGVPGQLIVRGSVKSGDGVLEIDGRIDRGDPVPALLRVRGDGVRVANTPTLALTASPDLTLALREQRWNLSGEVTIPRARIDASKLEAGVERSADVVVVDDPAAADPRRPWRARVEVTLGDDVRLEGFGFDGTLSGRLDISQRQGAQAIANGEILVRGRYEAYGQRLQIARGGLRYANSPLTEPTLDLRAERKVRGETVALEVSGTALNPTSRVVGAARMTDEEALSLLVTGRSLNAVESADRSDLSAAAGALGSVGSDLLTRRLRGRLGLDELGVSNDTRLEGDAFTLGKYLSPRLYVGYGIGLLTRGEVFTVRFLVTDKLELEAASGETQRAAINYRIER